VDEAPSKLRDWKFWIGGLVAGFTVCGVALIFLFGHFASAASNEELKAKQDEDHKAIAAVRERAAAAEAAHAAENKRLDDLHDEVKGLRGEISQVNGTVTDLYRFQTGKEPRKGK
jgi:hypothetical protein